MSEDQQPRSANRFSRFSRVDGTPSPSATAEPSLEDIAARALNRPRATTARAQRSDIPENFGSPDGFSAKPAPAPVADYDRSQHRPAHPPRIPDAMPVERTYASPRTVVETAAELIDRSATVARREMPPIAEPAYAPPAPPVESVEVEVEPELPPRFTRSRPDAPELPSARPINAEYEIVSPEPEAATPAPKKSRFKMPTMPSMPSMPSRKRRDETHGGEAVADHETAEKGPGIAQRALAAARAKAVPALQKSALWLAHNLQRRELRKRYARAIVFTHNRILDRKLEKLFFVSTLKGAITAPAPDQGILYEGPVPATVFDWVLTVVPDDLREFAFIDFRAGRGRTALLAAKRNFDRIIGFEFDAELFDDLQMNIAQYPRSFMKCRNIDCYRGDLDGIHIPDQPSVLWFSGAWRDDMIPGVLDYVRETCRQRPRRLYIVFANVTEQQPMLDGDEMFYRIDPGINQRLKLKLLSPMEFQVYRTTI